MSTPIALWLACGTICAAFRDPHIDALRTGVVEFTKLIDVGEQGLILDGLLLARALRGNVGVMSAAWQGNLQYECALVLIVEVRMQ